MAEMELYPCAFCQIQIAGNDHVLRLSGHTGQPQAGCHIAFIHNAFAGKVSVLAMGDHRQIVAVDGKFDIRKRRLQGVDRSDVVEMGVREQDPRRHEAFFPQ